MIALEVLASIALIVTILLQSGKEAGLSGAIAGNNDSYMGKGKGNSLDKLLASSTKWIALAWLVLTLGLHMV
jgi:preprotein translocase subunit SecG